MMGVLEKPSLLPGARFFSRFLSGGLTQLSAARGGRSTRHAHRPDADRRNIGHVQGPPLFTGFDFIRAAPV